MAVRNLNLGLNPVDAALYATSLGRTTQPANDPTSTPFGQNTVAAPLPGTYTPNSTYNAQNPAGPNAGYVQAAVQPGSGRITPGGGGWQGVNLNSSFDPKQAIRDAGIIGLDLARTATNPTRLLNDYLPPAASVALNPVGALTEQGIANVQAQIPGAPSNVTDTPLNRLVNSGAPPAYQPRTGGGSGGGGAMGGTSPIDAAIAAINAPQQAASVQPGATYNGTGYSGDSYTGASYGGQTYSGTTYNGTTFDPVNVQNTGAGYVAPTDYGFGNGYVPYLDQGQFHMLGYTGDTFNEAPIVDSGQDLGYIPYQEEQGPSAAEALLTTALERAQANALGAAAMTRGGAGARVAAGRRASAEGAALQSRAAGELAAMRADETERYKQRLLTGEIAARGRQVEESTATRDRASVADTALRGRQSTERVAGRQRELDELLAERQMTGELQARSLESQQTIARGNALTSADVAARDRASRESISFDSNRTTAGISAQNNTAQSIMNALNATNSSNIAAQNNTASSAMNAQNNTSASAIAAMNATNSSRMNAQNNTASSTIAAQNNTASAALQSQLLNYQSQNAQLERQLQAAISSGNIQSQQLIQDKMNQNAIDQLYLRDQLDTPTTEERLWGLAGGVIPVAGQIINTNLQQQGANARARMNANAA